MLGTIFEQAVILAFCSERFNPLIYRKNDGYLQKYTKKNPPGIREL